MTAPAPAGRTTGRQRTASVTRRQATRMRRATRRRYGRRAARPALGRAGRQRAMTDAVLELLPERDDLARVEDGRVRPGDDPDEEREREVPHRVAAEQVQREQGEDDGERGDDGPRERLHDRVIDDRVERLAGVQPEVLADAVEDDDRVVDREADDREHGGDEEAVDLNVQEEAEESEDPEDDRRVVEQRDDGGDPVAERGPAEVPEGPRDEQHDEHARN